MRSSPYVIAIRLLQAASGMLPLALVWWTAGRRLDGWTGVAADLAFWAYLVMRPLAVPLSWWTTTWEINEEGGRFRKGWLARQQTIVGWDEVVSIDVSQPYLHRVFGCYAVRFGLGTTQKQSVRIEAVSRATQERIAAVAGRAQLGLERSAGPATATALPEPGRPEHEVYRVRPADYLLIAVTYGQFVLFVPAVLSVLDQVDEWVNLPMPDPAVLLTWSHPQQAAALLAVLGLSMGYGWLVAWLRFRGFRVVRLASGYVTSGGLLSSERRTVPGQHISGLKVTQNPLMRALGFGRVSVLTKDGGDQPMANLLFPAIKLSALPAALGAELPVNAEVMAPTLRLTWPARLSLGACGLLVWASLVAVAYLLRPEWIVSTGTIITAVVALGVNSRWVVATTVPARSRCYARRGVVWVSHVEFDLSAVHVVESSQGLVGRLSRTWSVALHYYDGRVRCVRAVGCGPDRRAALAAALLR